MSDKYQTRCAQILMIFKYVVGVIPLIILLDGFLQIIIIFRKIGEGVNVQYSYQIPIDLNNVCELRSANLAFSLIVQEHVGSIPP